MVSKKPAPPEHSFSVPQTSGQRGWLVLTQGMALWITGKEARVTELQISVDERLCGDTFLCCEKIRNDIVVSDIFIYNSIPVFQTTTFAQRYAWLQDLMRFFAPCSVRILHKSALEPCHPIHGTEYYTDEKGAFGTFVETGRFTKHPTLPDVYLTDTGDYLKVPDLKTSVFLRTLGPVFSVPCTRTPDGAWFMQSTPCNPHMQSPPQQPRGSPRNPRLASLRPEALAGGQPGQAQSVP